MDEDEGIPPAKKMPQLRDLDPLSIEELEGYIGEMEREIIRVKEKISAKKAFLSGAESVFSK